LFLFAPNMNNCTKVLLIVDTEEILSSRNCTALAASL
jgi:hypothetical protein